MHSKISIGLFTTFLAIWCLVASPVGADDLLFYRDDGLGAVGYIDKDGKFQMTDSRTDFAKDWSQIVSHEGYFLFYRNDGLGAIGRIQDGKFSQVGPSLNGFAPNWSKIVSTRRQRYEVIH